MSIPCGNLTRALLCNLAMAALYFLSGLASLAVAQENHIVTVTVFAAEGFALAGVLLYGPAILPGIFLGQLVLALHGGLAWPVAVGIGLVNTSEAALALLLFRSLGLDQSLPSARDLLGLLALIVSILQPFSALAGNLVLIAGGVLGWQHYWHSVFAWWLGNVMGQILVTPGVLLLFERPNRPPALELAATALLFALLAWLFQVLLPVSNPYLLLLPTLLPLLVLVIARGLVSAVVAIWAITLVSVVATHFGVGAFTQGGAADRLVNLNFFLLAHALLALVIGIMVCEKRRTIRELRSLAHHDFLTGLPNRNLLWKRIKEAVVIARLGQTRTAVCFLDVDGFKKVNDRFGHHAGDEVLKAVAFRISEAIRGTDSLFRMGGDEFVILFTHLADEGDLRRILDKILERIRKPIPVGNRLIRVSASIGVALCPDHGESPSDLVVCADNAMYQAKRQGRNRQVWYQPIREEDDATDQEERPPRFSDWAAEST